MVNFTSQRYGPTVQGYAMPEGNYGERRRAQDVPGTAPVPAMGQRQENRAYARADQDVVASGAFNRKVALAPGISELQTVWKFGTAQRARFAWLALHRASRLGTQASTSKT